MVRSSGGDWGQRDDHVRDTEIRGTYAGLDIRSLEPHQAPHLGGRREAKAPDSRRLCLCLDNLAVIARKWSIGDC